MTAPHTLRVVSVRKQNPRGFGGAIFTGKPIDLAGNVVDAASYVVVRASGAVLGGAVVEQGQWWEVTGDLSLRTVDLNGYRVTEKQIEAACAGMVRPSGEHIVTFMAESPSFEGIGFVKARRLWDAFGEDLFDVLDRRDADALCKVLSKDIAFKALDAWAMHGDARSLQWLQAQGFDVAMRRKVIAFFGAETPDKIEEDPYRLLSFCASWKQVDTLARTHFAVPPDDPRRLQGAVEEACYRLFATGHTAALSSTLMDSMVPLLGQQSAAFKWRPLVTSALSSGLNNGSFVIGRHGIQPLGAMVMESTVARAIAERMGRRQSQLLSPVAVDEAIVDYEFVEDLVLNTEQRRAVHVAAAEGFACITGGAGVGKTTVLKALYAVYERASINVVQVALAGRAAKRMQEATGRPASTIASFLRGYKEGDLTLPTVVVIDEASMVDIITMHRICELLPDHVRLLLVGDPNQLMPVGPGLVLHAVTTVPGVPLVELTVVKRYGNEIRQAAHLVRDGIWPTLPNDPQSPIAFIPCATDEASMAEAVLALYEEDPARSQILSSRKSQAGGVKSLNALCQQRLRAGNEPIVVWNDVHDCIEHTGLRVGDVVLCTRNLWDHGLQNGSLGKVVETACEVPTSETSPEAPLAWIEWDDGVRRQLGRDMLDDVELGYAITVHKAQGSQWPRIIVPVTRSRLLDRTLLYTAITRAQVQVILVGDEDAAREAVARPPRASTREVGLDLALTSLLRALPALPKR